MRVKLNVYSALRKVIGKNVLSLEVTDGSTVHNVLKEIDAKYGEAFIRETEKGLIEAIIEYYNVFLNGKGIDFSKDLNLRLNDGDEIVIVQPVGGG